jgi:tetratricopeptide (TPR) repeat protein
MSRTFGRYTVLGQLGRGAMGVVYLAQDPMLNRKVAVKTVDLGVDDPVEREFLRSRLLRDARAAAVLKHPNIVGIYDVFEEDGHAYLVMEYVEGESLETLLKSNPMPGPVMTLNVLRQMADALDYTHARGVIHRDIKPANVMIDSTGTAKIMDFGIARITDTRTSTPTGMVMGTVEYMAPEQILAEAVDGRADQFALAVVAYRMMTGSTLFGPNTIASLTYKLVHEAHPPPCTRNASLPPEVDAVLAKALAKSPAARFSSCCGFTDLLEQAYSAAPTAPIAAAAAAVMDAQPARQATPAVRSRSGVVAVAAAVLVLGSGLAMAIWKPWQRAPRPATEVAAVTPALPTPVPTGQVVAPVPVAEPAASASNAPKVTRLASAPTPAALVEKAQVKKAVEAEPLEEDDPPAPAPAPKTGSNPSPFSAALQRGQQQVRDNDYPGAIQSFAKAISLRPESAQAHYSRGAAYQHVELYEAAIRDYSEAIRLEPQMARAYSGTGACLVRLHRDPEALIQFQKALDLKPDLMLGLTGRAGIYLRRKQYAKALADYDKAISIRPNYGPAYLNRAHAREALGDFAGAAADRQTESAFHKQ